MFGKDELQRETCSQAFQPKRTTMIGTVTSIRGIAGNRARKAVCSGLRPPPFSECLSRAVATRDLNTANYADKFV